MAKQPPWSKSTGPMPAWDTPSYANPMMGDYDTGTGAEGDSPVRAANNNAITGPASPSEPRKTAFHRGAMGAAEALGARLTVSPSMKMPSDMPSGVLMNSTRLVKSATLGRSNADFQQGILEAG